MTNDNNAGLLPAGQTITFNGTPLRIGQLIGSGATSEVYRGTLGDGDNGRAVVIKAMKQLEFADALSYFRGEGDTLSQLPVLEQRVNEESGRGLPADYHVAPHSYGRANYAVPRGRSVEYLVMDFIEGRQVPDLLAEAPGGRLPEAQALTLGFHLFHTLDVLHNKIHKSYIDLKFENLWWEETPNGGRLRMTDFGTLDDIPPGNDRGVRRDLVIAATYLCKMLTGYMPTHVAGELRGNQVPRVQRMEEISLGSRQLLARLLHPNAAARPRTAADVLDPGPPRAPDAPDLSGLVGLMNLTDYWTRPVESLVKIKDGAWARGTEAKGAARLTYLARARVVLDIWARRNPQADPAQVAQEREQLDRLLQQSDNLANGIALFRAGSHNQAEAFFAGGRGESYEPDRIALFRRWSYAARCARAPGVSLAEDDREGVERALDLMSRRNWSAARDQLEQLRPRLDRAEAFAHLLADLDLSSALDRAAQGSDPAAAVSAYNDALAALVRLPQQEKEAIVRDETGHLLPERDRLADIVRAQQARDRGAQAMANARAAFKSGQSEPDEEKAGKTFEMAVDKARLAFAVEEPAALPDRQRELAALVDDALNAGHYGVAAALAHVALIGGRESPELRRRWHLAHDLDATQRDLEKGELPRFLARVDAITRRSDDRAPLRTLLAKATAKAKDTHDADLLRTLAGLPQLPATERDQLNQEAQRIDANWQAQAERRAREQRERMQPVVDAALLEVERLLFAAGQAEPRPDFGAWSQAKYLNALNDPRRSLQEATTRAAEAQTNARKAGYRLEEAERLAQRVQNARAALDRAQQQAERLDARNRDEAEQERRRLRQLANTIVSPAAGGDREAQLATAREVLLGSSWYLSTVDPADRDVLESYHRAAQRFDYLRPQAWAELKGEADKRLQRFRDDLAAAEEALARGETQRDGKLLTNYLAPYEGTPESIAFEARLAEILRWQNSTASFANRPTAPYQPPALAELRRGLPTALPAAFWRASHAAAWLDGTTAAAAAEAQQKMGLARQRWSAVSSLQRAPAWSEGGAPPADPYAANDPARAADRPGRAAPPYGGAGGAAGGRGPESYLPLIKWWFDAHQTRRRAAAPAEAAGEWGWNAAAFLNDVAAAAVAGDADGLRRVVEAVPTPPDLDRALDELTPDLWRQALDRRSIEPVPVPDPVPPRPAQPRRLWPALAGAVLLIVALLGVGYAFRERLGLTSGPDATPTVIVQLSPTPGGGLIDQFTPTASPQPTPTLFTPTIAAVLPTITPTLMLTPTATIAPTPAATAPPPEASSFYVADSTLVQPPPPVSDAPLWLLDAGDAQPALDGGLWLSATDDISGEFLAIQDFTNPISLTWRHDQPLAEGVYQLYALDTAIQSRGAQRFDVRLDDQPVQPLRGRAEVIFGFAAGGQTDATWLPIGAYSVATGQRLSVQVTANPESQAFAVPALLVARLSDRERALLEALPAPDAGRPLVALLDDDNVELYTLSGNPLEFKRGSSQWAPGVAPATDPAQHAPPVWNGRYQVTVLEENVDIAQRAEWLPVGRLPAGQYQLWVYVPAGSNAQVEYEVVADGVPLTPLIGLDQAQFVGQWIDVGEWTLPAEARVSVWATGRLAGNVSGATVGIDAVALLRVGE